MTEALCVHCHAPEPDAFLCPECTARLRTWLVELAGHAVDLTDAVLPRLTSRRGEKMMVRGEGETPLPFNLAASEALWILHSTVSAIARDIVNSRGMEYMPLHTVHPSFVGPLRFGWSRLPAGYVDTAAGICRWLAKHVDCIALAPDALETWDMVKDLAVGALHEGEFRRSPVVAAVDTPVPRILLGPCDAVVDGRVCGLDVRAPEGAVVVRCGCMSVHRVAEFQVRVLTRMGKSLMTAAELAGAVQFSGGPKADTIAKWKRRGQRMPTGEQFVAHGQTPEGADLFRVSDFLAMMARKTDAVA